MMPAASWSEQPAEASAAAVQQLPRRFLGQVRGVVDDAEAVERADELDAGRRERAGAAGAAGVTRGPPCETDDPQPRVEERRHVVGRAQRVGSFQKEDS